MKYPVSVLILYTGGTSGDDIDTLEEVKAMTAALNNRGHAVTTLEVNEKNWTRAVREPADVVFNLVGDEGWKLYMKVAKKLEELGRVQAGHDRKCLKYVLKKADVKNRMKKLGISTPGYKIFRRHSDVRSARNLVFPMIVKPTGEHAGVGISQDSVVIDKEELAERVDFLFRHFPGDVIAEEFIDGREIHVTVMGNGPQIKVLPLCEVVFSGEFTDNWPVYTYEAKWEKTSWEYWGARITAPAKLDRALTKKIEDLAVKTYIGFGCRDIARFDVRLDEKGQAYVIDLNISPGLNIDDQEAAVKSALAYGWSYDEFIEKVVIIAYERIYGYLPHERNKANYLPITLNV